MRTSLSRVVILLGAALASLASAACGYDPKPVTGTLKCSAGGTCPEGYECAQQYCWRPPNLLGTWTFDSPSTRTIACDGKPGTTEPWGDIGEFADISRGGSTVLTASYYCDWDLDLDSDRLTSIVPGQSCNGTDLNDPTIMFTWHGEAFTLSSSDGKSGTLDASLPYDYVTLTGSGSCTMHFTGTMSKS